MIVTCLDILRAGIHRSFGCLTSWRRVLYQVVFHFFPPDWMHRLVGRHLLYGSLWMVTRYRNNIFIEPRCNHRGLTDVFISYLADKKCHEILRHCNTCWRSSPLYIERLILVIFGKNPFIHQTWVNWFLTSELENLSELNIANLTT